MMLATGNTLDENERSEGFVKETASQLAIQADFSNPDFAKHHMIMSGMHLFDAGWNDFHSATFRQCVLKAYGTTEEITIPIQTCTKVIDIRNFVSMKCMVEADKLDFVAKQGCSWVKLKDKDEMRSRATVKGIKSFKPRPHEWKDPICLIGAGYKNIGQAMLLNHYGNTNFLMFERYDQTGGHAWLVQANKTSRLQTDLAAFHVWFGPEWADSYLKYPSDWSIWPKRDEVVAHLQHAVDRSGIRPNITLNTEVLACQVVGRLSDFDRYYNLTLQDKNDKNKSQYTINASLVQHTPGAYFAARNIVYPGEEDCGMHIGFGMMDDMPYDHLDHNRVAILGNGAFGVENIRTACEFGAAKVYLVTRRKNLACPRMACWFVHQGIFPTPAGMLLRMYAPMYECGKWEDPWTFWSVGGRKETDRCVISSASRFGIGDVTFLATAMGRCEYVEDTVKRMSTKTLHLNGGGKIENIDVLVKALGLLADFSADKMHSIKKTIGLFPDGDHRRNVTGDPLGMHASNFTTMSAGIGFYGGNKMWKVFVDHPKEWVRVHNEVGDMFPTVVVNENKPCWQFDSKHAQVCSMMIESAVPLVRAGSEGIEDYMHSVLWAAAPLDRVWLECVNAWDAYQEEWKAQGYEHPYVPYPYTLDTIKEWMAEYEEKVGPLNLETKNSWITARMAQGGKIGLGQTQGDLQETATNESMRWWKDNCSDTKYKMPGTRDTRNIVG